MRVELKNVGFRYDAFSSVLNDISFSIKSASSVSIVGSSGSGKSTLLRLMCGLLPNAKGQKTYGKIMIDSCDITSDKTSWRELRSKGQLGFMFQEPCLLPYLNVEENIRLPLKILRKTQDGSEAVAEYLSFTELDKHRDKLPKQLSGGMTTRVALARTFITNPRLLLLDEPYSALDIAWKSKLYDETKRLKNRFDTTIVLVTHDIFEAINISPRIIVLSNNHTIVADILIENWSDSLSYSEVVNEYHQEFVRIKQIIEETQET